LYPKAPSILKDAHAVEFLGLPEGHSEARLHSGLLNRPDLRVDWILSASCIHYEAAIWLQILTGNVKPLLSPSGEAALDLNGHRPWPGISSDKNRSPRRPQCERNWPQHTQASPESGFPICRGRMIVKAACLLRACSIELATNREAVLVY
jgi:hypothetical protein